MSLCNDQELEDVDVMLEDCLGQLRPCSERLVCRAVWRDGAPGRITEEPVWPNPESQAWQQQGWENRAVGTKDAEPPPPPDPVVSQRICSGSNLNPCSAGSSDEAPSRTLYMRVLARL